MARSIPSQIINPSLDAWSIRYPDRCRAGMIAAGVNGAIFIEDMDGYDKLTVQFIGGNSGASFKFEGTNDLRTPVWETLTCESDDALRAPIPASIFVPTAGLIGSWTCEKRTRYMRLTCTQASISGNSRWASCASQGVPNKRAGISPDSLWRYISPTGGTASAAGLQVTVALQAASSTNVRKIVNSLSLVNNGTVTTEITIQDSAGLVLFRRSLAASQQTDQLTFDPPLIGGGAQGINMVIGAATGALAGAAIYANIQGATAS